MPEEDAAHAAGLQPRLEPGIKARIRPLEYVNNILAAAADEGVERRACAGLVFKGRGEAAFAHFGGVERDAAAGGFQVVEPFPVRREKRPAEKGEGNLSGRRGGRRRRKSAVPVKSRHRFGKPARRTGGGYNEWSSYREEFYHHRAGSASSRNGGYSPENTRSIGECLIKESCVSHFWPPPLWSAVAERSGDTALDLTEYAIMRDRERVLKM